MIVKSKILSLGVCVMAIGLIASLILPASAVGASAIVHLSGDYSISCSAAYGSRIASTMALNTPQGQITPMVTMGGEAENDKWTLSDTAVQYQLTLDSTEGGSITTPGEGTFTYDAGTVVRITENADQGYHFINWTGDVAALECQCHSTTITMNGNYHIRANFEVIPYCFIATAAYDTPMAEEIQILREFRDEYLLTNPLGQAFVDFYYKVSPPIAEFITEHPSLKPVVRAGLMPAVATSAVVVNTTAGERAAIVSSLVFISMAVAIWVIRRQRRYSEYT
jgi:hypothetical protein